MVKSWLAVMTLCVALLGQPSDARAQTSDPAAQERLKSSVDKCVRVVHNTPSEPPYPAETNKGFDAYYSPADGKVYNNAFNVGRQNALYLFHKCMTQQGMPLNR